MGSSELDKPSQTLITEALHQRQAYLAAISLWEISMLDQKKRIVLDMPCLAWINKFLELTPIQNINLSPEIVVDACYLPGEFHPDPADRMIAATARVEQCGLMTRDARMIQYGKQGFVLLTTG